ncbi:flagellar hook-length control protein FliK [Arthrobacter sp. ov118]|uniref:flagellar hook-length control protein FliK n=1 Tax=Arthrobacter sp. ov118 TaxID=1761747 RepID=UPI0008EEDF10|nr:flagellar hook-length control protein FliK [Arthrobacter sp. ov118]SFU12761.1 Flagellar hook-length control protein FliK [Arthrobacter sp. ov118]
MKAGASAVALAAAPARGAQQGSDAQPGTSPETASFDSVLSDLQGMGNATTDGNATAVNPAAETTSGRPADASANPAAGMAATPGPAGTAIPAPGVTETAPLALSRRAAGVRTPQTHAEAHQVLPAPDAPAAAGGSDDSASTDPRSTPAPVGDNAAKAAPGTDAGSPSTGSPNTDASSTTALAGLLQYVPAGQSGRPAPHGVPASDGQGDGGHDAAGVAVAGATVAAATSATVAAATGAPSVPDARFQLPVTAGPLPAVPLTATLAPAMANPGVASATTQLPAGAGVGGSAAIAAPGTPGATSAGPAVGVSPTAAIPPSRTLTAHATASPVQGTAAAARVGTSEDVAALPFAGPAAGPDRSTPAPGQGTVTGGLPRTASAATGPVGTGSGLAAPAGQDGPADPGTAPAFVPAAAPTHTLTGAAPARPDSFPDPASAAAATPAAAPADAPATVAPTPAAGPTQLPATSAASPQAAAHAAHAAPQPAAHAASPLQPQLAKPLFTLVGAAHGQHVMTLKVSPEDLGPLTVRAHIDAAGVRIELFAPGDVGRVAVRGILPELRKELSDAGFRASLDLSDHSAPGGTGQHGAGQNGPGQDRAVAGGQYASGRDSGGNGSGPGSRNGPPEPRPGHRWDALADDQAVRAARILNGPQTTLDILV